MFNDCNVLNIAVIQMNEQSDFRRKDPVLFGAVKDPYNPIFKAESILKQLYILKIILHIY